LPGGVDPCDFIATHGSDPFRALLATAVDALEHKFKVVTNGLDTLTDTHRASQAAEQLLATLAQLRPARAGASSTTLLREEQMLSRIARRFHLPKEKLRSRLNSLRREATARPRSQQRTENDNQPPSTSQTLRLADLIAWECGVLELIILDPTLVPRMAVGVQPEDFTSPAARRIYLACCRIAEETPEGDFGRLLAEFDEPEMKSLLVQLDESCALKATADRERWLADLLETHRRRDEKKDRRTYLAAARQSADDAEQLLAELCQQSKPKHQSDYERRKK
jgi:DNA primase